MRSTPAADASTRSKIRDAAVLLFGRSGFEKTTVREIAAEAGVSAALVIHHFGSKDALREACDAHIVGQIMDSKDVITGGDLRATMELWLRDLDAYRPAIDYLSRMLTENSEAGDRLFDNLVERTGQLVEEGVRSGMMRQTSDPQVTAAVLAAQGILPLVLERHLARALGEPGLSDQLIRRLTIPLVEIYTDGIYTTDAVLQAAKEALARTSGPASHKGAGDPNQDPDPPVA